MKRHEDPLDLQDWLPGNVAGRNLFRIPMGSEGKIIPFDERNHLDERLTQFFDMEYNGITAADDYLPELFQIAK